MDKKMDKKVKAHLMQYCKKQGYEANDDDIIVEIMEASTIHREEICQYRWWNEYEYVVEIDGMLIGYINAEANRDESVFELGYEFDPSTVCEMRAVQKTITTYVTV